MSNPPIPPVQPAYQPPGNNSNKTLIIVLSVVGGVLLLGCACGIGVWWWAVSTAKRAIASIPAQIEQAAATQGLQLNLSGGGGRLPGNFPSDVPQYPGSSVVFSISPPDQPETGTVTLRTNAKKDDIFSYYAREMGGRGWSQLSATDTGDGGLRLYTKGERSCSIAFAGDDEGMLTIVYGKK